MQSEISKCNQCNSILHDDDLIICDTLKEDIDGKELVKRLFGQEMS